LLNNVQVVRGVDANVAGKKKVIKKQRRGKERE
jgi:hypothetical protein